MSKKAVEKTIMVFGTFDGLHEGHLNFFGQARALTTKPFLVVSVARDQNVKKIKGDYPIKNEKERIALIKKCNLVNKVVLSGVKNHIPHIVKEQPDIIALGYDQQEYVKNLKKDLRDKNVVVKIVRLKPYKENIYKNKFLKNKN